MRRKETLIDKLREWAYSPVRGNRRHKLYEAWDDELRTACERANAFGREQGAPQPDSENNATAKSIARWVWNRFTPPGFCLGRAHGGATGGMVSKGGGTPAGTSR
ncbi:DNA primase, partial [Aeromonas caviae]|nr:DNA primase [Aeromonas caviae]